VLSALQLRTDSFRQGAVCRERAGAAQQQGGGDGEGQQMKNTFLVSPPGT